MAVSVDGAARVLGFEQGSRGMAALLGGKGANLAEMTALLGSGLVPAGFTITTRACVEYLDGDLTIPPGTLREVDLALTRLEEQAGRCFGDPEDPLLLSVRSGGRVSMPGMMDTVLNLGLNDASIIGFAASTGNLRLAWDSFRRLIQMFGTVVASIPGEVFEREIDEVRSAAGVESDSQLGPGDLEELVERFKAIFRAAAGRDFPESPRRQLQEAIAAVFRSWQGDRAVAYRRIHGIPDQWGTAANVQTMVFGNRGADSGSGVAFSRDETTGAPEPSGEFLVDAQGEDVVSGSRNTRPLAGMADWAPALHAELVEVLGRLERHFGDMQDVEFTVEEGRLWILQTRSAKRPARASVRFATDAFDEGLLSRRDALMTFRAGDLEQLLHPMLVRPIAEDEVFVRGVPASPGAATGDVVFSAAAAVEAAACGRDVILVRRRTEADDIAGFHAARGILTTTGGKASHAALVARGMGRPCVCGAAELEVDHERGLASVPSTGETLREGDRITIDGGSGLVTTASVELGDPEPDDRLRRLLGWADGFRRLGVRANADTAADARRARELGAEGIGLCRTEHMFLAGDRGSLMRAVILAGDGAERAVALDRLLGLQQADFEELLDVMAGMPVTVRLLDPPLHEFLRDPGEIERQLDQARSQDAEGADALAVELERTLLLREANPMLGTRGVRLGLLHPEIYAMQVKAICRAIAALKSAGRPPVIGVMIPLVAFGRELAIAREQVEAIALAEGLDPGVDLEIGTMIELPRACLTADSIAASADFFSFGTNDLTQTALGFSRDDVEGSILPRYGELGVVDRSPFATIDVPGVGELVRMAAQLGRSAKPGLELGICGEHGGDPDSITFFDSIALDYVSCSPFRVPVARMAAGQAAVAAGASPAITGGTVPL